MMTGTMSDQYGTSTNSQTRAGVLLAVLSAGLLVLGAVGSAVAQTSSLDPIPEGELLISGCPEGVGLQYNQCAVETSTGSVSKLPELISLNSSERRPLTDNDGLEGDVIESPDATSLAFSFQDEFYTDIFPCTSRVMDADGGDSSAVGPTDDTGCFYPLDWSGSGWLLLGYMPFEYPSYFYKVRPDGTGGQYLSPDHEEDWTYGAWINSGRRILFRRDTESRLARACTMSESGRQLRCFDGTGGTQQLELAPYGHRFAYTRFPKAKYSVLVRSLDGVLRSKLAMPEATRPSEIRWSPDGTQIAITSYEAGAKVFLGNVRSSDVWSLPLHDERISWIEEIQWAPSGDFLALLATDEDGYVATFTMNREGSDWRQITEWDRAQSLQLWRPTT